LKPEMFATVELALPAETPVLAVPEDSLQHLDGNNVIFVAAKNKTEFEARQVELGRSAHGLIEIVSGLKAGERYAAKGSFILKSELKKGELGGD
jgi:cobalt-zinc-cadmium efflux system membrane fusion protein